MKEIDQYLYMSMWFYSKSKITFKLPIWLIPCLSGRNIITRKILYLIGQYQQYYLYYLRLSK